MKTCDLGISYPGLGIRSRVRVGDKVAQLVTCQTGLFLGKTVYSLLPQSTQLQNGYLALIRHCLESVRYMLPATLEYRPGD